MDNTSFMTKFMDFLKGEKKWWLTPILIILAILIAFIIITQGPALSPVIYGNF